MAELNTPLTVGDFEIKNRLVMAPLTRARSGESRVPNDLMVEYYQQRANAGLILTEATVIGSKLWVMQTPQGYGHKSRHKLGIKLLRQFMLKVQNCSSTLACRPYFAS